MFTCERQWKDIFIHISPVGREMLMKDSDSNKIGCEIKAAWGSQQNQWKICQEERFLNESRAHLHWMQLQGPGHLSGFKCPQQWSGTLWDTNACDIEETWVIHKKFLPHSPSETGTITEALHRVLLLLCPCPFPGFLSLARVAMLHPPTGNLASARKAAEDGSWNGNINKLQTERTNG